MDQDLLDRVQQLLEIEELVRLHTDFPAIKGAVLGELRKINEELAPAPKVLPGQAGLLPKYTAPIFPLGSGPEETDTQRRVL